MPVCAKRVSFRQAFAIGVYTTTSDMATEETDARGSRNECKRGL